MIISPATSGAGWFLNGIANLQQEIAATDRQLSSGYRVQDAADAPSQTPELIGLESNLVREQSSHAKLTRVQAEAQGADQALGSAISLVDNARSLAVQAANSINSPADLKTIAQQIQGIQQQLVSLANTRVEDRSIFGGELDQTDPYQFDTTTGAVTPASVSKSSRIITDAQGQTIYQPLTAPQIFDPQDSSGRPTADSTFAALASLQSALAAGNQSGITSALSSLENASAWLNRQQAYYGQSEQRLTAAQNDAANQMTAIRTRISAIRDTDVTQAATDLTQESTSQAAAVGAQAEISQQRNLFSYLG